MTCRDEVLDCAKKLVAKKGRNEFTIVDIQDCMKKKGSRYPATTICTHVSSRMCSNAPQNHAVKYPDFTRIARGLYKLM